MMPYTYPSDHKILATREPELRCPRCDSDEYHSTPLDYGTGYWCENCYHKEEGD